MKSLKNIRTVLLAALCAALPCLQVAAADDDADVVAAVRATYRNDRQQMLAETLPLTETESAAFWPLYRSYRTDMDALGDRLIKLVLEYSDAYPDVPKEKAEELLKGYVSLEEQIVKKRGWYFKRVSKVLPPAKVLRWAQLENRMDLGLRLQLVGTIPLMPTTPAKQ